MPVRWPESLAFMSFWQEVLSIKKAPGLLDPEAFLVEVRGRMFHAFQRGPDYAFIHVGCGAS